MRARDPGCLYAARRRCTDRGESPSHDPPALGLEGLDGGRDARKLPLRDVVRLRARLRDLARETGVAWLIVRFVCDRARFLSRTMTRKSGGPRFGKLYAQLA